MSRQSTDEQLRFLLSCVRHSNNGKVDFETVAGECGIVSKGAAAKRYERMMKANNIDLNGNPAAPASFPSTSVPSSAPTKNSKKDPKTTGKGTTAKKRKLDYTRFGNSSADDDDGSSLKREVKDPAVHSTPKSRRASHTASVLDKLNLNPSLEDDRKVETTEWGTGDVIGRLFDGTFEVVDANPNWGYGVDGSGRLEPIPTALPDVFVPFDQFVHSNHPLHGPPAEPENSMMFNAETCTTADTKVIKKGARSVSIED